LGQGGFIGNFVKCECDEVAATVRDLPLFLLNGFNLNPVGETILMRDQEEAQLSQPLVLIGSTFLNSYRVAAGLQSGNDLGFDASLLSIGAAPYKDPNLTKALGNPKAILAMAAGAVKLITYSKHQGQFAYPTQFDKHMRSTFTDPYFGMVHDMTMSYEVCGEEVKYFVEFGIGWDLVGMAQWSEECEFAGVKDVFLYNGVAANTTFADIESACGQVRTSELAPDGFCESAQPSNIPCVANFGTDCGLYSRHGMSAMVNTDIIAFRVNGGPNVSLGGTYNLTDATDSDAILVKLKLLLGAVSGVRLVSKRFTGGATYFEIFTDASIGTIEFVSATTGTVALASVSTNYLHVYNLSTASNGATITDLAWIGGDGVTTFNGAPGTTIGNVAVTDYYGDNDEFFAEVGQGGSFQLTMTDSVACASVKNLDSVECPVLWAVQLTAFDDANDNDILDGGELGLLDIKVQIYADAGLTTLVAVDVTDASGFADFTLSTGQYYMSVDAAYGAAVGRTITTVLPKGFYVDLAGVVMYANTWTANGLIPIGPV
jgi:hypothetical protein